MLYQKDKLLLICGPCAIENKETCQTVAKELVRLQKKYPLLHIVFKSSWDKANRISHLSKRGVGLEVGMEVLQSIKQDYGFPILSDIHETHQAPTMAQVCDVLQIPAFLCRQTDLLLAAAATKKTVNIKKGQYLSPYDMQHLVQKLKNANASEIWQTERGTSFGYGNLIVDMKGFQIMKKNNTPVIFDITHSLQLPGANNGQSGGQLEFAHDLSKAALATGYVDGIFVETHPNPSKAISDQPVQTPLEELEALIASCLKIWSLAQ